MTSAAKEVVFENTSVSTLDGGDGYGADSSSCRHDILSNHHPSRIQDKLLMIILHLANTMMHGKYFFFD